MRRILATLAVIALLFSAGSAWADFDDGSAAYKRGDYETALKELRPLAEQGDAKAQYNLGFMYAEGQGVPENPAEAVKWYRMAAEQGHADAQFNLGNIYGRGEGVPVNNIKAYMWFSLAKAQGDKEAAGNLDIVKKRMNTAQIAKAQELAVFSSASQSAQKLVEDLRSGKSNVRAVSSTGNFTGVIKFWRKMKSKPDFKVTVINQGWSHGTYSAHSAEAAVEEAIKNCTEKGGGRTKCKVYAVGDNIVQGHSQAELADAIEAYQLEVSGSKSTSSEEAIYCKTKGGIVFYSTSVYYVRPGVCPHDGEKITKAEYDHLKNKKTDTASSTEPDAASSGDDSLEAKLEKLKKLLEKGLITEEEAAAKRAKLLEDM